MGEVFLEFRNSPVVPITHVRSTIILLGIQAFRQHGLFARYAEMLTPALREEVFALVAGVWVPVELAVEHYRAADRLDIDAQTVEAIGAEVADRTYKHVLAPVFAQAKRKHLTPWETFSLSHENNDLNNRGGDVQIVKEGPRQALYVWAGQPCASVGYFVQSFAAFLGATVGLFCARVSYRVVQARCSPTTITLRLAWSDDDSSGIPNAESSTASLEDPQKRS